MNAAERLAAELGRCLMHMEQMAGFVPHDRPFAEAIEDARRVLGEWREAIGEHEEEKEKEKEKETGR